MYSQADSPPDGSRSQGKHRVEQTPTQELYNGFGHALARAFELVVTPAVFGVIGYVIDRQLGTHILFTAALLVFCIVGMSVRMYYGYVEDMKAHEARGPWGRAARANAEKDVP
jgi:F0F1-type ATP synthase assembly protein I